MKLNSLLLLLFLISLNSLGEEASENSALTDAPIVEYVTFEDAQRMINNGSVEKVYERKPGDIRLDRKNASSVYVKVAERNRLLEAVRYAPSNYKIDWHTVVMKPYRKNLRETSNKSKNYTPSARTPGSARRPF